MALPFISYGSGGNFAFSPQNFIAEDAAVVHDNLSTSGLRERVFECNPILISFTIPGLLVGNDFLSWKSFYAYALQGTAFLLTPNPAVNNIADFPTVTPWAFNCVLEDAGFKPKRVGYYRYSIDCKFRVVPGVWPQPSNSGVIMDAFLNVVSGSISDSTS